MAKDGNGLQQLSFLIGKWKTVGEVLESPKSKPLRIDGIDSYQWTLDNKFILHEAQVMMGDAPTKVIEFIGPQDSLKK